MHKFLSVLLLVALALSAVPAGAAEPLGEEYQVVSGGVAVPTRFTDGNNGYPGLGRRLWLAHSATNGSAMYVFPVDPEAWGGAFTVTGVSDATGSGDLDIFFYSDFGNLELLNGPGAAVTAAEYQARGAGGDSGFVPFGATKALVFTTNAVNATFTYRGYTMPVVSLAGAQADPGQLDVTVPAGAYLGWRNDTGNYAFVRHNAANPAFDSSPEAATGIRNGERFVHQFNEVGTFAYTTSAGTGTVTVVPGPGPGTPAG